MGQGAGALLRLAQILHLHCERQKVSNMAYLLFVGRGNAWGVTGEGGLHHIP